MFCQTIGSATICIRTKKNLTSTSISPASDTDVVGQHYTKEGFIFGRTLKTLLLISTGKYLIAMTM